LEGEIEELYGKQSGVTAMVAFDAGCTWPRLSISNRRLPVTRGATAGFYSPKIPHGAFLMISGK
jgi:hypothetical protein